MVESSDLIDLAVLCLNGEGCNLKISGSSLGLEVYLMASRQLPRKAGKLALYHLDSKLMLHQTLREQGIAGSATLSCTFVPIDLLAAWLFLKGLITPEGEIALHGVTRIVGATNSSTNYLYNLPQSLENLTFADDFNQSLEKVPLPSSLQTLTFGFGFNKSLEHVTLPTSLKSLIDVWQQFQREPRRSDSAKQSSELEIRHSL